MRLLGFLSLMIVSFSSAAQTTITNASFPEIGDTLRVSVDEGIEGLNIGEAGEGMVWDFSDLRSSFDIQTIFRDVMESENGDNFPTANMFVERNGGELFFETSENKIIQVGQAGLDPFFGFLEIQTEVTGEAIFRVAPLSYQSQYENQSGFSFTFPFDALPGDITDGLPIQPDSIRFTSSQNELHEIDAYGTLKMPDGNTYDVLRDKVDQVTNNGVEMLLGIWLDVPEDLLPEQLSGFIGETETRLYRFLSNEAKEIMAEVSLDEEGITESVSFRSGQGVSSLEDVSTNHRNFKIGPNPVLDGVLNIERSSSNADVKVVLRDPMGRVLKSQEFFNADNQIKFKLSDTAQGSHLISIYDRDGNLIHSEIVYIKS